MKSFSTIIFDFGGVVGADANSWTKDTEVVKKTGLSREQVEEIFIKHWETMKSGKSDLDEFFHDIAQKSLSNITIAELRELYHRKITSHDEVISLVNTLSAQYKLYILANESLEGMKVKKEKFHLDTHFLKVFNSAELALSKPDPMIYKTVLKEIQTSPEEILFIDDQEHNIKAADELGIKGIHYTSYDNLMEDLILLNVLYSTK